MVERLFFALWPSSEVRASLLEQLARISTGADAESNALPLRFTHPRDLHITLVFVGVVEPGQQACVEAAGDAVAVTAFDLCLREISSWGRQRLWIAQPGQVPSALLALVDELRRELMACGVESERRRYHPHVTLARKAPTIGPVSICLDWPVADFVLAASSPGRRPSYRIINRWSAVG